MVAKLDMRQNTAQKKMEQTQNPHNRDNYKQRINNSRTTALARTAARAKRGILLVPKIVSEYDQEIPQSQTADNPVAPRGRAAQPSQDTRNTN